MRRRGETVTVSGIDRGWFAQSPLSSVKGLLKYRGGQIAAISGSTDTFSLDTSDLPGAPPLVFVKRYRYRSLGSRLLGAFRGTLLGKTRARFEYDFLGEMRSRGVSAVRPIAAGEYRKRGFVRGCILITEGAEDVTPLDTVLGDKGGAGRWRLRLVVELATSVRSMHEAGIFHGGFFGRNILVRRDGDGHAFLYLDPDRRGRIAAGLVSESAILSDLSDLAATGAIVATRCETMRFLRAYLKVKTLGSDGKVLASRIVAAARPKVRQEQHRVVIATAISWLQNRIRRANKGDVPDAIRSASQFFERVEGISAPGGLTTGATRVAAFVFRNGSAGVSQRYSVRLRAGDPVRVSTHGEGKADLHVEVDEDTWLAIVNGDPSALAQINSGGLKLSGDSSLLGPILSLVDRV